VGDAHGSRLFQGGETVPHTLADVLRAEIDFGKLPASTPQPIRQLLKRCLDRNVKTRLRDIGEARIALANPVASEPPPVVAASSRSPLSWFVAAVLLVALATVSFIHFREQPPEQQPLRYTIAPPVNSTVHSFAISPNGRHLAAAAAINGKTQLWLRDLDALQMQPISGTDGAEYPFWSPDSRYIAFFAQGRLKKVATTGGPAQSLCEVPGGMGGSWNRDDVIVFASAPSNGLIQRISAAGGTPSDVIKIRGAYKMPIFLPDGRHFLYELNLALEKNGIYLGSLDNGESRLVLTDQSTAVFRPLSPESRAGHLIFIREGTLMAQGFDSGSGQLTGEVFPLAEGVSLAQFRMMPVSLSQNGTLVYVGGLDPGLAQIAWFDRTGKNLADVGAPGTVITPSISPDEKTVAYTRGSQSGAADIWLHDEAHDTELRFTSDGTGNFAPFWAPKGERILFGVQSVRGMVLNVKSTTGSGEKEPLLETGTRRRPFQWSRDGRFIVYGETAPNGRDHLWVVAMDDKPASARKPIQFLQTEFNEIHGQLSADSRWMAYVSDESGERQVYVRPLGCGF
jgi:Tol biopolymer transport system component